MEYKEWKHITFGVALYYNISYPALDKTITYCILNIDYNIWQ